jgi:hypothetical protein
MGLNTLATAATQITGLLETTCRLTFRSDRTAAKDRRTEVHAARIKIIKKRNFFIGLPLLQITINFMDVISVFRMMQK